ncbi:DUF805 domain-containing protein [Alphaproteobacteria bacterium]|nr:DUF805 domain-containing protein [Alphaproteobacteria bacterium]
MNFFESIKSCFIRYTDFSGRSMRSEYWNFGIFIIVLTTVADYLDAKIVGVSYLDYYGFGTLNIILTIVTTVPSFAVSVRRLHDINKSGWWILLLFTIVGWIPLIYWACLKSDGAENRFGPSPIPDQNFIRKKLGIIQKILFIISVIIFIIVIAFLFFVYKDGKDRAKLYMPELKELNIVNHYVGNILEINDLIFSIDGKYDEIENEVKNNTNIISKYSGTDYICCDYYEIKGDKGSALVALISEEVTIMLKSITILDGIILLPSNKSCNILESLESCK